MDAFASTLVAALKRQYYISFHRKWDHADYMNLDRHVKIRLVPSILSHRLFIEVKERGMMYSFNYQDSNDSIYLFTIC